DTELRRNLIGQLAQHQRRDGTRRRAALTGSPARGAGQDEADDLRLIIGRWIAEQAEVGCLGRATQLDGDQRLVELAGQPDVEAWHQVGIAVEDDARAIDVPASTLDVDEAAPYADCAIEHELPIRVGRAYHAALDFHVHVFAAHEKVVDLPFDVDLAL